MNKLCNAHAEELKAQLKKSGLKVTGSRLAILDIFKHAKKPLNVKNIAAKLPSFKADIVTIYRNIESLKLQNIVKEINFNKNEAYYELAGTHHHHVICESCGRIEDVPTCNITPLEKGIRKAAGFARINRHSLEFFGLCANCSK